MPEIANSQVTSGQVNLEKLLKKTKLHPNGRVQIDPETGEIKSPQNPTKGTFTAARVEDGKPVLQEVPRYVGHVTVKGSPWRIAFDQDIEIANQWIRGSCPEERYDEMCKLYERRVASGKKTDDFRPELTEEEMNSYLAWKKAQDKSPKKA